jgi:hypothetical protein
MNTLSVKKEKQLHTTALIETLTHSMKTYASISHIHKHPSIFLKGQPGVGKSQAVYKIARALEETTHKQVRVIDVRLLMFNPVDLRGIPVADAEKKYAIWLKPYIFQLSPEEDIINILFLDELTSAPQSVQAAAYQIALDRRIGEHQIPNNTFIIAAGNRQEDEALTYDMPSALKNRFMHFEVIVNLEHWLHWANKKQIHKEVLSFIESHPHYFVSETFDTPSNIIITPRSWEMLSDMLHVLGGTLEANEVYIASFIGEHLAHMLINLNRGFTLEDILESKVIVDENDLNLVQKAIQILESSKDSYIYHKDKLNTVFHFLLKLPRDFSVRLFKQLIKVKPKDFKVIELEGYQTFMKMLEKMNDED